MIRIGPNSPVPLNDQIKAGFKGLVAKGLLRPGDQIPSIRGLATSLKVNPNTVARAFRELSLEGFLEAQRGSGNYISDLAKGQAKDSLEEVRERLREAFRLAKRGGLPWSEISALMQEFKGEEK
jgi:GntR family transcriptional regulator